MVILKLIPSVFAFGVQILIAIILDGILHYFELGFVGRYLGPAGTFLILLSFVYSLRKRKIIAWGSMRTYLAFHEAATWSGALLILVHSGVHFNAVIPWLATAAMLVSIASGFTGRYLLGKTRLELENRKEALLQKGLSEDQAETELLISSLTVKAMEKWRSIHHPITAMFAGLATFHVFIVLMYGAL